MPQKLLSRLQTLFDGGFLDEAKTLCLRYCRKHKADDSAWYLLGKICLNKADVDEAIACFEKVLVISPEHSQAAFFLGRTYVSKGCNELAIASFQRAIRVNVGFFEAHFSLANVYLGQGNFVAAEQAYRQVLKYKKDHAGANNNLGMIYLAQEKYDEAAMQFTAALKVQPESEHFISNLGRALYEQGLFCEAIRKHKQALNIAPLNAEFYYNLGVAYGDYGDLSSAEEAYRKALHFRPGYLKAHSNLLFLLSYNVLRSPEEMLREHCEWDRIQGAEGRAHRFRHVPEADSGRRLRVGYVSPDFKKHSVSYFFEPLLAEHDREQVEVSCYAEVVREDEMTARLRELSDHWCSTVGMSDAQLAQRIHADGIDILVDLAGHTANTRVRAFTYKPAPIQVTYLGYFATTGLEAMDYWLSDAVLTADDTVEQSSETIYRLARSCLVYKAPEEAPAVVERPANGNITFGSFNDLSKVSEEAVKCWSEILRRVPGSRLLMKARQLSGEQERAIWCARFEAHGIGAERLIMRSKTAGRAEHLAMYGEVDIALDSMPRTGGATTAEALWMGVPVISLAGARFIERLSASMLNAAGLDELIAATAEAYVEKAVALASASERRRELRRGLRQRMAASPLCDARGLAQGLEEAYRAMWSKWCLSADAG